MGEGVDTRHLGRGALDGRLVVERPALLLILLVGIIAAAEPAALKLYLRRTRLGVAA
jgi:hypothetical protein